MTNGIKLTVAVSSDVATELDQARRRHNCSRADLLNEALRLYLDFGDDLRRAQALKEVE